MEKSLRFFEPGEKGVVKHVVGQGPVKRRLFDMGVTPGVEIEMKKLAPLGDPMEVSLRGYELSLRKSEAQQIVMEVDGSLIVRVRRHRNNRQALNDGRRAREGEQNNGRGNLLEDGAGYGGESRGFGHRRRRKGRNR